MTYVSLGNAPRQLFECRFQSSHVPDSSSCRRILVEPQCFSGHVSHDCRIVYIIGLAEFVIYYSKMRTRKERFFAERSKILAGHKLEK